MFFEKPKIYADFNKYDENYRLILTCLGTIRDLEKFGIELERSQEFVFYMDSDDDDAGYIVNLMVDGIVDFDDENNRWVATVDETTYRHETKEGRTSN